MPDPGTYIVLNANSLKALDVRGASDKAGTNVQQYRVNGSDAQVWAVTQQEGGWQLLCSLTGKCLDVAGGAIASGTNVQQWSDNDGRAQRWEFEDTGETLAYQGTDYPVYRVAIAADTSLVMAVSGSSTADGANVILYARTSGAGQRWLLVPVPALSEGGTYELVPAIDQSVRVDVAGGSKANGANAQVYASNGSAAQVFEAEVDPDSLLVRLLNANSGKALDVYGAGTNPGTNVIQWTPNSGANQWWLPVLDGTMTVNGNEVPTYQLRNQNGNGLCLDVAGGSSALRTNVQVWNRNGSLAQRFGLVKTEVLGTSLPAPTPLLRTLAHGTGTVSLVPSFQCDATAYQARTRRTAHMADGSLVVGEWENAADGSTARDGWGEAWEPTFEVAQGGLVTMPLTLSEALTPSMPLVTYEVEVRAFSASYGPTSSRAHGPSTVTTVSLALDPTVTVGDVTLDLSGDPCLVVPVSSDLPIDGNRVSVTLSDSGGSPLMAGPVVATVPRSGAVAIPTSLLWDLPSDGDSLVVTWAYATPDGGLSSGTSTVAASMGSGTVAATVTDGPNLTDVVATDPDARVFLLVERGDGAELAEMPGEGGTYWVCPPLNVPYSLYVATDGGVAAIQRQQKAACGNWWVWGPRWSLSAHFEAQRGARPSQAMGHSPDVAVLPTTGRAHPVATATRSSRLDLSASGWTRDGQGDFEALAVAMGRGMVPVYRTARGDWHRVAVTGVDLGYTGPTGNSLKVSQEAVTP